jgi:hypothetical protein
VKKKNKTTHLRPSGPSPLRDLRLVTRDAINRMKADSQRAGVRLEQRKVRPNAAKLKRYRQLQAAFERKLAASLTVQGLESVFAAGEDLRMTLARQLGRSRTGRRRS